MRSAEVPELPQLEAIDGEQLLKSALSQLESGKHTFIARKPGVTTPIEGYRTSLHSSEIVLHICIREAFVDSTDNIAINRSLHNYIIANKLKVI